MTGEGALKEEIRARLLEAFGLTGDEPEFSTEPGSYLWALAQKRAEDEAFKADLRQRGSDFMAGYAAALVAKGILPEGFTFAWEAPE